MFLNFASIPVPEFTVQIMILTPMQQTIYYGAQRTITEGKNG